MKNYFKNEKYSALDAIKNHCKECCNGVFDDVKDCPDKDCSLWFYRTGEYTGRKKTKNMTIEQKEQLVIRMKKGKENAKRSS